MTQLQKVMLDFISLGPPTDLALLLLELDNFATQWRIRSCLKYLPNETAARPRPPARTMQVTVTVSRFRSLPVSAWHGIRPTLELRRVEPRKKLFLCMQEAQLPARAPRPQGCADNATTPSSIFCCGPVTSITHNLSGRGARGSVSRKRSTTTWEPS